MNYAPPQPRLILTRHSWPLLCPEPPLRTETPPSPLPRFRVRAGTLPLPQDSPPPPGGLHTHRAALSPRLEVPASRTFLPETSHTDPRRRAPIPGYRIPASSLQIGAPSHRAPRGPRPPGAGRPTPPDPPRDELPGAP